MLMSFIAGGAFVGLIWLFQDEAPAQIEETLTNEIVPSTSSDVGPLSFDDWADEVAQLNRESVVGLNLSGNPRNERAQAIRLGTNGYLITSAYALIGADEIGVVLSDGSATPPAQRVASDPVSGIEVLKINTTNLQPPTFADDADVFVRDRLVALVGATSDTNQSARAVDVLGEEQVASLPNNSLLSGLFRLSADLDEPWSGAAVLEENGGIVAMTIEARNGSHYAIPISRAREVAEQLIDAGSAEHRAWLGVEMGDLSEGIKVRRELLGGVLMSRVWDETPAARGGLVAGDIIIGIDDANILDRLDLQLHLATLSPGDEVEVRYSRVDVEPASGTIEQDLSGEIFTTRVVVGARSA